jgi:hypothetical protein
MTEVDLKIKIIKIKKKVVKALTGDSETFYASAPRIFRQFALRRKENTI